ncbi:DUF2726 domain-containing protein [Vibrio mytili]|uniref:DUF2726 domain-containing protein n=1 Tax=Vibrio mytili TaxID=50718 RepID=UPI003C6F70DC
MVELIAILSFIFVIYLFKRTNKNSNDKAEIEPFTASNTSLQTRANALKKKPVPHKKNDYLCSKSENGFYQVLLRVLPSDYIVHCQVSMMALIQPVNFKDNSKTWAKRIDYVITDRDTKILAVIELDDSSHRQKKRQERDSYVNSAFQGHHKLIRIEAQSNYDPVVIASLLERDTLIKCNAL